MPEEDQSCGGGAQGRALGHLTPLVSASPLVPDKARVPSLSGYEVRVPVSLLQHGVTQTKANPRMFKAACVCVCAHFWTPCRWEWAASLWGHTGASRAGVGLSPCVVVYPF